MARLQIPTSTPGPVRADPRYAERRLRLADVEIVGDPTARLVPDVAEQVRERSVLRQCWGISILLVTLTAFVEL